MDKTSKISYEPEADVLTVEVSRTAPIDFAKEVGNVVVHFTKQGIPVVVEVLDASQFVTQATDLVRRSKQKPGEASQSV